MFIKKIAKAVKSSTVPIKSSWMIDIRKHHSFRLLCYKIKHLSSRNALLSRLSFVNLKFPTILLKVMPAVFAKLTWNSCPGINKILYESGKLVCDATLNLIKLYRTCDTFYFRTKTFLTFRRPFIIIFTIKPHLRSETYIWYNFY